MMRNTNVWLLLTVGILVLAMSCSESVVESEVNENLLSNGSFEQNNKPSLDGWRLGNQQLIELVNQAAPNGGNWALQLTSDWVPATGFVYTPITNVKSGDIVRLSASVRGTGSVPGTGIIRLVVGQDIYSGHKKEASSGDTVWTKISVTDTLNMSINDTLWVILSSPPTELIPFQQLFDCVKLEKVSE